MNVTIFPGRPCVARFKVFRIGTTLKIKATDAHMPTSESDNIGDVDRNQRARTASSNSTKNHRSDFLAIGRACVNSMTTTFNIDIKHVRLERQTFRHTKQVLTKCMWAKATAAFFAPRIYPFFKLQTCYDSTSNG